MHEDYNYKITTKYNIDYTVEYNDNTKYRECLRNVFNMDLTKAKAYIEYLEQHNQEYIDTETEDELLFDEDSVLENLSDLLNLTKNVDEFCELYKLAAAKIISIELHLGIIVCFSYDYFYLFHKLLVSYLKENKINNNIFDELKKLLE